MIPYKVNQAFYHARGRCTDPKYPNFPDYGGRGIKFLFNSAKEFYEHIGDPPSKEHSLDRINNDGHYEMGNVRWTTFSEQQKNKRIYKNNTSGVKGVTYVSTTGKWIARCNEQSNGKRRYLYVGESCEEACRARLEWERSNCTIKA